MCNKWHQLSNVFLYLLLKSLPFSKILKAISLSDKLQARSSLWAMPVYIQSGYILPRGVILYFLMTFQHPITELTPMSSYLIYDHNHENQREFYCQCLSHKSARGLVFSAALTTEIWCSVLLWPQSGTPVYVVIMTAKDQSAAWELDLAQIIKLHPCTSTISGNTTLPHETSALTSRLAFKPKVRKITKIGFLAMFALGVVLKFPTNYEIKR